MDLYLITKKVFALLNAKEKVKSFILLFFILIGIFLENIGIVLLLPISSLLIGAEIPEQFARFEGLLTNWTFTENILFSALILMFLVYLFKNLYLVLLHYFQLKFIQKISLRLSTDLFSGYLKSNYSFHLNSNSAYLIRNVMEAGSFEPIFTRSILLITEIIMTLSLFIVFIIIDFQATLLVTSIFLLAGFLFTYTFSNKVKAWGTTKFISNGEYLKTINQGLNGIKEIIFNNGYNYFIKNSIKERVKILNSTLKMGTTTLLPKAIIEMLIILSAVLTIIYFSLNGKNHEYIVPILAVYVAAAYRLGPACNRIINNIQNLKFSDAGIEKLSEQLKIVKDNNQNIKSLNLKSKISFNDSIYFKNISFSYKEKSEIYSNINLQFPKNKIYGLIGDSGSGKSTFINLLTGLLQPTSGKIFIDDVNINNNLEDWQKSIAYVAQDLFLTDDTILKNIAFGKEEKNVNINDVIKIISKMELENFVKNLKDGMGTIVGEKGLKISGGQRQRIALGRALYRNPKILVLDEATNSLDQKTEMDILKTLKNFENITIFMVSHQKTSLHICDEIYEIKNQKILKV